MEARQQNQASGLVDVRMHNEERKVKGDAVSDHVQSMLTPAPVLPAFVTPKQGWVTISQNFSGNGKVRDTRGQTDQRLRRYYLTMDSPYRPT